MGAIPADVLEEYAKTIVAIEDRDDARNVARDIFLAGIQAKENHDHAAIEELRIENHRP